MSDKHQITNFKSQTNFKLQCPNDQNKKNETNDFDIGFDFVIS